MTTPAHPVTLGDLLRRAYFRLVCCRRGHNFMKWRTHDFHCRVCGIRVTYVPDARAYLDALAASVSGDTR